MRFCSNCHNMYYLKINDNNNLMHYCRCCGHEDSMNADDACVSNTQFNQTKQSNTVLLSEFTKQDPTLPRTNAIKCPNEECSGGQQEVLYLRYDDTNMRYVYMCTNCDTSWKTSEANL